LSGVSNSACVCVFFKGNSAGVVSNRKLKRVQTYYVYFSDDSVVFEKLQNCLN